MLALLDMRLNCPPLFYPGAPPSIINANTARTGKHAESPVCFFVRTDMSINEFYGPGIANRPGISTEGLESAIKAFNIASKATNPAVEARALNLAAERETKVFQGIAA